MRISKKFLAGVLAALMAISMMPFTAFAADTVEVSTGSALKTAVAGAASGDTIKFTSDLTLTAAQVGFKVDKDITFDLNGKTISGPANGSTKANGDTLNKTEVMFATDNANVVFDDSVGGGSWTFTYTGSSAAYFIDVRDNATVTFNGGTYISDSAKYGGYIVYQRGAGAKTTINDGTFWVHGCASKREAVAYISKGSLEINGGKLYTNKSSDWVISTSSGTSAVINDGEINGTLSISGTTLTVNGGTFKKYDTVTANDVSKYYADGVTQLEDGTVAALPTATVTDITASTDYDVAYQFEANNDGVAFNDYKADFVVSVDKTVNTADVKLFGKFGAYDWTEFPEMTAEANTEYYLARDAYNWTPTYAEICNDVQTFSCAVVGDAYEATTLTVKLVIYKEGVDPIVISSFTHNIAEKALEDTMSITVDNNIDLNINMDTTDDKVETIEYTFTNPYNDDTEDTQTVVKSANDDVTSFTVALSPAQVNDEIKAVAKDENGDVIREVKTSIADYCQTIISTVEANPTAYGAKSAELAGLAQSTLDYGKAASDYFNYNEAAFTEDYSDDYKNFDPSSITYEGSNSRNFPSGITLTGVTYVATSVPELRFYIDTILSDSELEAMNDSLTSNIGTAKFVKCDDKRMLQITNINVVDFGKQINVKLGSDTILTFVPISWAKSAATKDGAMGDLGKSICYYYAKSVAYFG